MSSGDESSAPPSKPPPAASPAASRKNDSTSRDETDELADAEHRAMSPAADPSHDASDTAVEPVVEGAEEMPVTRKMEPPATPPRGIPDIITQTDAQGRPLQNAARISGSTYASNETGSTGVYYAEEIPPPIPEDLRRSDNCLGCLIKYLCCLNFETMNENNIPLLDTQSSARKGKICLVLDLDETLVHSSFELIPEADFTINIVLEGKQFEIYVVKRPGVDEFLEAVCEHFEVVLFTASVPKYAMKVMEEIDKNNMVDYRLYREHCTLYDGNFVKDLNRLGRNTRKCIIVDNSPFAFQFQPENAIGITTFLTDKSDKELIYCKDFLLDIAKAMAKEGHSFDVRTKLKGYNNYITKRLREDMENEALKRPNSGNGSGVGLVPADLLTPSRASTRTTYSQASQGSMESMIE